MKNVALWGIIVVTVGVAVSCRLGDSLDGYSSGTAGDASSDSEDSSAPSEANVGGSAGGGEGGRAGEGGSIGGLGGEAGGSGGIGGFGGEAGGSGGGSGGVSGSSGGGGGSGGSSGGETGGLGGAGGSGGDTPELKCPEGFVEIKPGKFTMGSPEGEPGRYEVEDLHEVTLTKGFCMSETEVTQGQYEAVMGVNPSYFNTCGEICPVERVSWHKAAAYCNKLSEKEGLKKCYTCLGSADVMECSPIDGSPYDCKGYRLPTEAEWEYAARAGSNAAFYNGNITETDCTPLDSNLDKIGWYCGNAGDKTHPVKGKEKNDWGLYDMSGNVGEWCHDGWDTHLGTELVTDPFGADGSSGRVVRGGSWKEYARRCRSPWRVAWLSNKEFDNIGFRPVRSLNSP